MTDDRKTVVFPPTIGPDFVKVWEKLRAGSATAGISGVISVLLLLLLQRLNPVFDKPEVASGVTALLITGINGGLTAARNAWKHWYDVRIQK